MRRIEDRRFKGLPLPPGVPVTRIGDLGWNALRDLEYPVLVLHEEKLVRNITTMADYCRQHQVELAAHAKTSLSPQLIRRQMEAGAWGATAATAAQVRGLLAGAEGWPSGRGGDACRPVELSGLLSGWVSCGQWPTMAGRQVVGRTVDPTGLEPLTPACKVAEWASLSAIHA
jgi:hypothetical protein